MTEPTVTLLDLRDEHRPDLLAAFVSLYDRTFTDPTEREDPAEWDGRLWATPKPGEPLTHLLVTMPAPDGREVLGGLLFEYYTRSRCGLLAYLAVDAPFRRRGLARLMIDRAMQILRRDAERLGGTLRMVFAETEDPTLAAAGCGAMPPRERLAAFSRMGAAWVDLPYVQPELSPGAGRGRHMMLLAFGPDGKPPRSVNNTVLREFLDEYYRSLGVTDPAADPDWVKMAQSFEAAPLVRDLSER